VSRRGDSTEATLQADGHEQESDEDKTMRGLIGKKLGMTQLYDPDGNFVPVTVIEVAPNHVLQVKTASGKDGYDAVKIATGATSGKNLTRPEKGVFKAANIAPQRTVTEFRLSAEEVAAFKRGDVIDGTMLVEGALVDVRGVSKGKGFSGVIKRHHFKGAKEASHGTHEYKRHGGSIGMGTYPGRVFKNQRMAGQMGNANVTIRNLRVVAVHAEDRLVLVSGSVPGGNGSLVRIYETKPRARKRTMPNAPKKK
jgi:large subunit ribosomal protein L3